VRTAIARVGQRTEAERCCFLVSSLYRVRLNLAFVTHVQELHITPSSVPWNTKGR
jgi:hypothetical protein